MTRRKRHGPNSPSSCQICVAEDTIRTIAGYRIGARCEARIASIAADAGVDFEIQTQLEAQRGVHEVST